MPARRSCRRSPRMRMPRLFMHSLCCATTVALLMLTVAARAEYIGTGAASGATCRVFVLATDEQTRFALVESYADQDGVDIYDDFPVVTPGIRATPLEGVYKTLRPSFLAIQAFLLARARPLQLEPRHCHTHLIASGAAMRALDASLLDALFARVHQDTIEDAQFPFLLARDDLRALPLERENLYMVVGANYLDGRVPAALTPGDDELYGVFSYRNDTATMAFDNLERWRRSKRSKLKHTPLDATDLFSREYAGYGAAALRAAVDKQLAGASAQSHVCVPTRESAGDAAKCVRAINTVVRASTAACPDGSFCALGGTSQPRPLGTYYAAGLFRSAVVYASRVLQQQHKGSGGDTHAPPPALALPTPTLAAVRAAADYVCALPLTTLLDAKLTYAPQRSAAHACIDLCATVVLLQAFGVADTDARVVFASQMDRTAGKHPVSAASEERTAWLTGAFLHLEALQQRKAFAVEAELLAVQVDEGVPIGFHLSALLFAVALVFLYATATSGSAHSSSAGRTTTALTTSRRSSYQRVVNGSGKAKQPLQSTQAILFIDDASE